jgi:hypothetical protein
VAKELYYGEKEIPINCRTKELDRWKNLSVEEVERYSRMALHLHFIQMIPEPFTWNRTEDGLSFIDSENVVGKASVKDFPSSKLGILTASNIEKAAKIILSAPLLLNLIKDAVAEGAEILTMIVQPQPELPLIFKSDQMFYVQATHKDERDPIEKKKDTLSIWLKSNPQFREAVAQFEQCVKNLHAFF